MLDIYESSRVKEEIFPWSLALSKTWQTFKSPEISTLKIDPWISKLTVDAVAEGGGDGDGDRDEEGEPEELVTGPEPAAELGEDIKLGCAEGLGLPEGMGVGVTEGTAEGLMEGLDEALAKTFTKRDGLGEGKEEGEAIID